MRVDGPDQRLVVQDHFPVETPAVDLELPRLGDAQQDPDTVGRERVDRLEGVFGIAGRLVYKIDPFVCLGDLWNRSLA